MSPIAGISQFISTLMTSKPSGFQDGMTAMGDFDAEDFVNKNLLKAKNTPGTEINQVTQGIARLFGKKPTPLTPQSQGGSAAEDSRDGQTWIKDLFQ